ncbi:MAG: cation-translocating P-type ATPase [Acidimicrobiales bacterium]
MPPPSTGSDAPVGAHAADSPGPGAGGNEPWLETVDVVVARAGTDVDTGLTDAEAQRRLATWGPNVLEATDEDPWWRRLLAQFRDPLVLLLLVAIAISLVAWVIEGTDETPFDAIVIAAIVAANAILGFWQEARAARAVLALREMAAARATVIRDARIVEVDAATVVPGDVLVVTEGDAIAADGRIVDASMLRIAEAPLTGESEPVLKRTDVVNGPTVVGDRVDMAYNGTAVVTGRGRIVVTATGMRTEMGRIASLLDAGADEPPTPLEREIARVGRILGIAVVAIALFVIATIFAVSDISDATDVVDVLLVGVSLAVAAVPEGLPAILTVVLALGVQRMAARNAIVTRLSSVETLGSASVICTDKTGTLTRNEMTIQRVVTASGTSEFTGSGYDPAGHVTVTARSGTDELVLEEVNWVIAGGSLANESALLHADGVWTVRGDPTEAAFLVAERKLGITERRRARFDRRADVPFDSDRKLMSTLEVDTERDHQHLVVTKGAPDVLLGLCTHENVHGEATGLTARRRDEILAGIEGLADDALRTLGVAYRRLDDAPETADTSLETDLVFLGTVGIIDPPRAEAAAAVTEARRAGIRVVMITGDHPLTALRIAQRIGIVDGPAPVVRGVDIETMDAAGLADALEQTSVFARVAPEHKLRIVQSLQSRGATVAMTGDGVNDAPALQTADIGVAMGITGTDVSKEASNMILADDDFATIVAAVAEGRGIFANIRKFLRYLLSSNMGEVLTMFGGVVAATALGLDDTGEAIAVPLLATHILWINLLTDSAPALALGIDPAVENPMDRPPRSAQDRVIDGPMQRDVVFTGFVMAVATLLALDIELTGGLIGGDGDIVTARTMAFTTLVLAQLFNCFNARSPLESAFVSLFSNPWLWGAVVLSAGLQVLVVHVGVLNQAFDTTPLDVTQWMLALGLASSVLVAAEVRKLTGRAWRTRSDPQRARRAS